MLNINNPSQLIRENMSFKFFEKLPNDLFAEIVSFLLPKELLSMKRVSKKFHNTITSEAMNQGWRRGFLQHFPHCKPDEREKNKINWRNEFHCAYVDEYKRLSKDKKKLFSLVKEGDINNLMPKLSFADLSLKDGSGYSLLSWASKNCHQAILDRIYNDIILKHFENENAPTDESAYTLLHWAAICNQFIKLKELAQEDNVKGPEYCSEGDTPLYLAAVNGHIKSVEVLLEKGADVDLTYSYHDESPLFGAARVGCLEVVKALLEAGATVDTCSIFSGKFPLYVAAEYGHLEVIKALLKKNASINLELRITDFTALHIAARNGHLEIVKALLENGANINNDKKRGETPLYLAAKYDHLEVVKLLLEEKADINVVVRDATALSEAVKEGHVQIVKVLLEKGADVNIGKDPLAIAIRKGYFEIAELLNYNMSNMSFQK